MRKERQDDVNRIVKKRQLSTRLSNYRKIFVHMAHRAGLPLEEIALVFGTTKQNVSLILKK